MKKITKVLATALVVLQLFSFFGVIASAETAGTSQGKKGGYEYLLTAPVVLGTDKSVDITVTPPVAGDYNISLVFKTADTTTQKVDYAIKINGKAPFKGAELLEAPVLYVDDGEVRTLSNGDQTAAAQKAIEGYITSVAYDPTGINLKPYTVKFGEGASTVTVTNTGNVFEIAGVTLTVPETVKPYADVSAGYSGYKAYTGAQLEIEAEKVLYRNEYSLTAKADTGSADITPRSATNSIINHIGGSNWSSPYQTLAWEIDVPQDGLYNIGFNFKQNSIIDGNAYRWLKIDGKTPFTEMEKIGFSYKTAWQYKDLTDDNNTPYQFYLTKGKHELSLTVTLAGVADIYDKLSKISAQVGELYLDIVMITSETPDANRDYELYKQIPHFEDSLQRFYDELMAMSQELNSRSDINGELDGAVKNMARVSKQMHDNRYESHLYLDTYYSYYQTLSSWLYDIKNMALSLDKIIISSPETKTDSGKAGFFAKLGFGITRFIKSFTGDYSTVTNKDGSSKSIKLWVNWGRDQVKVLNTLIQESFSTQHPDISVKVEQVNASVVQGIISNNSPDLYLHMPRTEPVNLAMRGVLYDLSNFSDYEQILGNFQKGAELPYIYNGKPYALPDTQGFNVMFVRDDIFAELGLEVPKTWDEYLSVIAVIQRKNMNAYLPYVRILAATTVNTGAGGLSIFPTMLMQNGETMYNKELNSTNLASPVSVQTFKFWTDFYTEYKLNPDVNFYQRFRVGTVPLGIAGYANYLTFAVAAPEIADKWSVHMIPGVQKEDGTIDHTSAGSGTGCAIMNSSKHKDAAWEFIKWWVSADTQYAYSFNCEAILGQSGRTATSNIEALSRLSWDKQGLEVILKQWENVREIEEVPGSYYVSRSIDQAFWAVYNDTATEKEAITDWSKTSDSEIKRKIAEYAYRNK